MTHRQGRVFVLGHRGMLGHVVARYALESGHDVLTTEERYTGAPRDALVERVRASGADLVINCLGLTKQRSDDRAALYLANALFPMHLMTRLRATQYLVHASTDCVFDGTRGGYAVDEEADAVDAYGFSKALGEGVSQSARATVIRASVIGPDWGDGGGLLAWFLRQPVDQPVPGYTNHRWNGITTLDWAIVALALGAARQRGEPPPSCVQPGTPVVTKYELLSAFREVLVTSHCVAPVAAREAVDRSLVPTEARPPIRDQLEQVAAWYPLGRAVSGSA